MNKIEDAASESEKRHSEVYKTNGSDLSKKNVCLTETYTDVCAHKHVFP